MPCYEQRRISLKFEVADKAILIESLEATGFKVYQNKESLTAVKLKDRTVVQIKDGKITVPRGKEDIVNEIKRGYSLEVITQTAQKFGRRVIKHQTGKITLA